MRLFLSILVLLVFVCNGKASVKIKLNKEINYSQFSHLIFLNPETTLESGILDGQEANDFDGPEFYYIVPLSVINPFQHVTKTVSFIIVSNFRETINQFFIDLPPPSFS